MKLKDMTENIKTRSAEPLTDDELENVSGGVYVDLLDSFNSIYYPKKANYKFVCTKYYHHFFWKSFDTGKEAHLYLIKQLKNTCPKCQKRCLLLAGYETLF